MVIDHLSDKTEGDKIIEVFVEVGKSAVWIPVIATQLYITDKNGDINKISEVRVRDLGLEREYETTSKRIDELTRWLKDNLQTDREYGEKWNERANLKLRLQELRDAINS